MKKQGIEENFHQKDEKGKKLDLCPECKAKLAEDPKGQNTLGSHNKVQSNGCKHCGQMFKSFHRT